QSRSQVLCHELNKQLPAGCEVYPVDGGMFVWMTIPQCDTFELAKQLLAKGVAVVPSPVFYPTPDNAPSALRLNFTNSTPPELADAAERLTSVLRTL
ncbi:aminotransferase class I/II-fold pyridoxal phosphate-dependent enzyme, partial [Vibrio parahaemolyticus]|uniref:aminotransferase class I/II-fold pyridoxal phosphate-dependent enzyme n=1 Tax=Vibrio parahaemolyticus TaxID=670 RepID=UPI001EEAA505